MRIQHAYVEVNHTSANGQGEAVEVFLKIELKEKLMDVKGALVWGTPHNGVGYHSLDYY